MRVSSHEEERERVKVREGGVVVVVSRGCCVVCVVVVVGWCGLFVVRFHE